MRLLLRSFSFPKHLHLPFSSRPSLLPLQTLISTMAESREELSSMNSSDSQIDELKHGFQRPEMYTIPLAGTVDAYDCHLFLCYKDPQRWPPRVEGSDFPKLFVTALKSRMNEIPRNVRVTICEGQDEGENSNGDVLIFPDMIRYKGLTEFDVDNFVEEVLVKGADWLSGNSEPLTGSFVFVCAHNSRDKRCGVCGPVLITKFQEEIETRGINDQVFVSPCSHIGGHKYAGNLVVFSPNAQGKVEGHWYGYVTPNDVPVLLDHHISKGEIIDQLWRGQMGLSTEEQKKAYEQRLQPNSEKESGGGCSSSSCCQVANGFTCCKDEKVEGNKAMNGIEGKMCGSERDAGRLKSWFKTWEQGDTLVALSVIGAVAASVAVAYTVYKRSS
ncbi:altered inheritance of mitochondria protein 32-like [Tasmannia lanceolata]|uniref:altered inheritance of mitochondria protein 32-like n=1 Tax=Tasmannia lanceolata TaxID=3420 RepID=UPI004063EFBD